MMYHCFIILQYFLVLMEWFNIILSIIHHYFLVLMEWFNIILVILQHFLVQMEWFIAPPMHQYCLWNSKHKGGKPLLQFYKVFDTPQPGTMDSHSRWTPLPLHHEKGPVPRMKTAIYMTSDGKLEMRTHWSHSHIHLCDVNLDYKTRPLFHLI